MEGKTLTSLPLAVSISGPLPLLWKSATDLASFVYNDPTLRSSFAKAGLTGVPRSIRVNGADCGVEAILLGVVTSIGGFLFGYDTGQISGMLLFEDFTQRFATGTDEDGNPEWVPILQSLLVSLMSIGTLIGALSGAYTADWWGRRRSLAFGVFMFLVGNIVQITAMQSWVHMMIGRLIAGLGVGNLSVGVPMFQSECSPREIRGAVVASYQLLITIGILISNIINYGVRNIEESDASWRIVIGLGMAFSLPLGIGILFVPESPRWLASRHDWEGARASMARLRGLKNEPNHPLVADDIKEMYKILEEESRVGVGSWLECFTGQPSGLPKLVWRTFLGITIHFLQQFTGVNYFFYYGATIFDSAGIDDPLMVQLILGAVNVVTTFYGLYVVEKYGRRWPLFIGALWQAAWLLVFAAVGIALPPEENTSTGIVMIVSACMFIASFAGYVSPDPFPLLFLLNLADIFEALGAPCAGSSSARPSPSARVPSRLRLLLQATGSATSSSGSSVPWPTTASAMPTVSSLWAATLRAPLSSGSSFMNHAPCLSRTSTACTALRVSNPGHRASGCRPATSPARSVTRRLSGEPAS